MVPDGAAFERDRPEGNLRAADEAEPAMVEIVGVEIVDRVLLRAGPHIDVDILIVERDLHARADVGHEMLAHMTAGIGKAVGEFGRLRQQQQTRIVIGEWREDHELRFDSLSNHRAVIGNAGTRPLLSLLTR